MSTIAILSILIFVILFLSGAPFFVAFTAFAIPFLIFEAGVPGQTLGSIATESVANFTLIAIPLFIFLGSIMSRIGATGDLFHLSRTFFGHIRGGLGVTTIVAAAGFGAMCGSGLATALAISSVAVPELEKNGYKKSTIAAICGSAGGIGLLIPPSLAFIVLGDVMGVSVGKLFIAGIIPGLLAMTLLCLACYFSLKGRDEIIIEDKANWSDRGKAFIKALPAFGVPAAILIIIFLGIATPTEAAGVACIVALILGIFYYKTINMKVMMDILKDTTRSTSSIWFIVMGSMLFGRVLGFENVPQAGARFISGLGLNFTLFVISALVLFFVLGMFFDAFVLMLAALPPLLMALSAYDVPLIWFGILFTVLLMIGQITPPVGITLYAAAAGAQADVGDTIKEVMPYLLALVLTLILLVIFPFLIIY